MKKRKRGRGENSLPDCNNWCFTLKTWRVETAVEQRLKVARLQQVQVCVQVLVILRKDLGCQAMSGLSSPCLGSSHVCLPLLFPCADHQRPETACDCGGHAADRPVHPDLLAGGGPPAEDGREVQHGGERSRQEGGQEAPRALPDMTVVGSASHGFLLNSTLPPSV